MNHKLISVAGALLCIAALPWAGKADVVATPLAVEARVAPAKSVAPAAATAAFEILPAESDGIHADVLGLAVRAVSCGIASGALQRPTTLTVIDYSRPSTEPRLWVYDTRTGNLLFKELVAHGRNTGENMATQFSDQMNSRQSSLGLFVTDNTYVGSNGYSLRLDGLEPGFNGRARDRAIVMHGAPYVNTQLVASQGRIGRSWGCPALREAVARQLIDTIRGGGVIFSYYPDQTWLKTSKFLNGCDSTESGGSKQQDPSSIAT